MPISKTLKIASVPLLFLLMLYIFVPKIRLSVTYGYANIPSTPAAEGCKWIRRSFPTVGISFFDQSCSKKIWSYQSAGNTINRVTGARAVKTFTLFSKPKEESPIDVVNSWFEKLSQEQKQRCEVFQVPMDKSDTHNSAQLRFKSRFKIDIKKSIVDQATQNGEHMPLTDELDFACGADIGSNFNASRPYFEFDSRSPAKYLLVSSLGNDGSVVVDLDTIRF